MSPTASPHTDDPATCPTCVTEGRALFDAVQYTEAEPLGPQDYGDHGGDLQATAALGRRFYQPRHDDTYAVIDVVFLAERDDQCTQTARTMVMRVTTYTICRDHTDPGGTEIYSDERAWELPGETTATDERMRELAAEFDPATLDWNGAPDGMLPCYPHLVEESLNGNRYAPPMRLCQTHPGSHRLELGARETAAEDFACDRNLGWRFVLEMYDPCLPDDPAYAQPHVELANLTRLKAAIRSNVHNREYEPPAALQIYRYIAPGQLQPLTWQAVPHRNATWQLTDDDDRKPMVADAMYEVVGPHPEGGGRLMRYVTVGLLLNGDS